MYCTYHQNHIFKVLGSRWLKVSQSQDLVCKSLILHKWRWKSDGSDLRIPWEWKLTQEESFQNWTSNRKETSLRKSACGNKNKTKQKKRGILQSFNNRFQTVLCMKHHCNNSPTNQYQRFLCQVTISICHSTKMPLISFYEEFTSVTVFLVSSVTATKHNILFSFHLLSFF